MPQSRQGRSAFNGAAAIAVGLLAVSCRLSSNRISLDNSSGGQTIPMAPGDKIDITLQTIGPGQYETPRVSSASVAFLGESDAGVPNPGGPRQLFRFGAMTVGRAEITIRHTILDPALPQTLPSPLWLMCADQGGGYIVGNSL
jgi:hypothetical protein